jgi:hypothetical protein
MYGPTSDGWRLGMFVLLFVLFCLDKRCCPCGPGVLTKVVHISFFKVLRPQYVNPRVLQFTRAPSRNPSNL